MGANIHLFKGIMTLKMPSAIILNPILAGASTITCSEYLDISVIWAHSSCLSSRWHEYMAKSQNLGAQTPADALAKSDRRSSGSSRRRECIHS